MSARELERKVVSCLELVSRKGFVKQMVCELSGSVNRISEKGQIQMKTEWDGSGMSQAGLGNAE